MRVTLKDVAREAGVAKSTVSFVLNNSNTVAAKTRKRVLEVIKELEYSPCKIASRLGKRQFESSPMRRLAFISCGIDSSKHSYFGRVLNGVTSEARKKSYSVSYVCTNLDDEYPADIVGVSHVDGVILTGRPPRKYIEYLTGLKIPFVLCDYYFDDIECSWVRPDNQQGIHDTVEYLHDLGHKKILFINGDREHPDFVEKEKYFELSAKKFGIEAEVLMRNDMNTDALNAKLTEFKATAIMASYDQLAILTAQMLAKLNLKIPEDISITGFDGEPGGIYMTPQLTTVIVELEAIGRVSTKILIDMIEQNSNVSTSRIPAKLTVRESCRSLNSIKSKQKVTIQKNLCQMTS